MEHKVQEMTKAQELQPASDSQQEIAQPRPEVHRILISEPMSATATDSWKPPRPRNAKGERIQVTAHVSEHGEIVERWHFSDTDVRWYRLERYEGKRVTIKVERRVAVGR